MKRLKIKKMPLFPPQGKEVEYFDDLSHFVEYFTSCWSNIKSSFQKLETFQSYQEPDNKSLELFLTGNRDASMEALRDTMAADDKFQDDIYNKRLHYVRLRPAEAPPSEYLLWELQSYRYSQEKGQDIRIIPPENLSSYRTVYDRYDLMDFMLIDMSVAFVLNYDSMGCLRGAWIARDIDYIKDYNELFNTLLDLAVPLDSLLNNHDEFNVAGSW